MFIETPRFPACPSFGFTSEPVYSVTHIVTAGGEEQSNENWEQALHRYTMSIGPRVVAEIAAAHEFYHAVGGTAHRFRFKDYADYKSSRVHLSPTMLDQPLSIISATAGTYQLIKRYSAGVLNRDRLIQKPIQGTILISDDGVLLDEGVDYTIDYTTGIVDILASISGVLRWGGEFDVPVRFDSEFPVQIVGLNVHDVQVVIKETRRIT